MIAKWPLRLRYLLTLVLILAPACTCDRQEESMEHSHTSSNEQKDAIAEGGQTTDLRYGRTYRYDPQGEFGQPEYDVTKTIVYHADGTGTFESETTGKFRWHFTPRTNGGEMVVTEWFDVRDPDGNSVAEPNEGGKTVMHIMRGGEKIHENGSDRIYEIVTQ